MNWISQGCIAFSSYSVISFLALIVNLFALNSAALLRAQPPRSEFLFNNSPSSKVTALFRYAQISKLDLTATESAAVREIETWYLDGAERLAELSRSSSVDAELLLREQLAYEANLRNKAAQAETELLSVLGHERFDASIRALNRDFLEQKLASEGQDKNAFLLSKLLAERLELDTEQLAKLRQIHEKHHRQEEQINREFFIDARELQEDKLNKLLARLTAGQRADYLEVIGKPIDWFRRSDPKGGIAAIISMVKQGSTERRVKSTLERDTARQDFAAKGVSELPERFDAILWHMLSSDSVRRECEMTAEQEAEVELLCKAIRNCCEISSEQAKRRKQELLNGEFPGMEKEAIAKILLPSQLAWLRRAELQLRLSPQIDTFGLADAAAIERFELTSRQLIELRETADLFSDREQQLSNDTNQKVSQNRIECAKAALEVLSDSQRARYQAWLGN
jgi:hypothetical protein